MPHAGHAQQHTHAQQFMLSRFQLNSEPQSNIVTEAENIEGMSESLALLQAPVNTDVQPDMASLRWL